ncbi:hypothetical protein [Pseudofrankia inefficax]|uniref:Uncharacterized protein n=1 Tax=Pseudofrankia inefficax (strain DSM 45817 / CECT 9037 / DDB 130130 / EuI1c) TaxID=298654 RepID=E3J0N4_PSEI1|nr:hypothetical protein [Pseudofrankia inefficax]ADP82803.1 hypothetical protein FraEuI1c_4813 [Pseudofrankia inefficax]
MVFRPGIRHVEYRPREWSFEPPGRAGQPVDETAAAGPGDDVAAGDGRAAPRRPPPRPAEVTDEAADGWPVEPARPPGHPAPWPGQVEPGTGPAPQPPPAPPEPAPAPAVVVPGAIVPGPPGGILDLGALAEVEDRLRRLATAGVDAAALAGDLGRGSADRRHALTTAGSSVAAVLWFDSLRAADRVSVTPHAAPLLAAVHDVLEASRPAEPGTADDGDGVRTGGGPVARLPVPAGRSARALRATGAGTAGPSGTVWGALARRFAGARFDHAQDGRIVCVLEYPELRDAAVWEAVTDERTPYLGELFWVVLVSGAAVGAEAAGAERSGLGGPAGPDRAARMFEAAGWQVLTLRHGRRLAALFGRPGGQALRGRLSRMGQEEYHELLTTHGQALRRRLAGPGTAGVGIAGLVDTLTDDEIHAALRDLGGHDLALLIDAFDEVVDDRPTALFAHVHDQATRDPAAHEVRQGPAPAVGITSIRPMGQGTAGGGPVVTPVAGGSALQPLAGGRPGQGGRGARLAAHVASYLDRAARAAPLPPPVPTDLAAGGDGRGLASTQSAFGDLLRGLAGAAPEAVDAIVTVSTRDADGIVAGWLEPGADAGAALASPAGRRHVAGALAPGAFAGVLGNLGVAWNRQGLPLLPIGVTDELAAGRVVPAWAAGCATDARSVLAVTDTGRYAMTGGGAGQRLTGPAVPAVTGGAGVPGVTRYEPAFAQDLAWCLLAALGKLGRADGSSSLLRLSARPVDQRAAAVPAAGPRRDDRRADVLAGGYRLRSGGPAPLLTLVGMGAVLPEVLAAADELADRLGGGIGVAVVTSADLLFDALRAGDERSHDDGPGTGAADRSQVLARLLPAGLRSPLVTVVDGDARQLGFLAGLHGDRLAAVGSGPPGEGSGADGSGAGVPVGTDTIVAAALRLLGGDADAPTGLDQTDR